VRSQGVRSKYNQKNDGIWGKQIAMENSAFNGNNG
jgi:hypothetical protein